MQHTVESTFVDKQIIFIKDWWKSIDRTILFSLFILMAIGFVLNLAASPFVAERIGLTPLHFVHRHALFLSVSIFIILLTSCLAISLVKRISVSIFVISLIGVMIALFSGAEVKGAHRWVHLFGHFRLQPSEFLKPSLVVLVAWFFSQRLNRQDMPCMTFATVTLLVSCLPIIFQPDIGQAILCASVWALLFFISFTSWPAIFAVLALIVLAFTIIYHFFAHVRLRIDRFFKPENTDTFQTDAALEALRQGGWLGKGPGEGTMKKFIPDGHNDFILAVAGEEFGTILCLVLVGMFAFIVLRIFYQAFKNIDPFCRFASLGLGSLFGLQTLINLSVNLALIPPKGMTLPFISYGGSSLLSLAFTMGFVLSLTRRRPNIDFIQPREIL